MSKNQKLRKKRAKKNSDTKTEDIQKEDEKPFDFGGLPERDLKKNLGCG